MQVSFMVVECGFKISAEMTVWHREACRVFSKRQISYRYQFRFEPPHEKTNKMACAPSDFSDQPGHPPSLIRVFAVRSVGS